MKKVLTIAAAVGFVTIPSIAFANAGSDTGATAKPVTAKVKHVETETEHGAVVSAVATTSNSVNETAPATPAQTTTITEAEARTIAQNTKAEATVVASELEREHGVLVFEITFSDGSKVYVDATTGEIVSNVEQEDEDEDHDNSGPSENSGRGSSNSGSGNSGRH